MRYRKPSSRNTGNAPRKKSGTDLSYWSGGHTKHRLRCHLVWIPKYRKRILTGPLVPRLDFLLREICEVHGWSLEELAIQPDHVHLLVQFPPNKPISHLVQLLKGGTSHQLRIEFPDFKEHRYGAHLWAEGYFAETVGVHQETVVSAYIRNQRRYG